MRFDLYIILYILLLLCIYKCKKKKKKRCEVAEVNERMREELGVESVSERDKEQRIDGGRGGWVLGL